MGRDWIMDDYVAIDVETANPDRESICQIGVVPFEGGIAAEPWVTLVSPETYFDPFTSGVHGITEQEVCDAPIFPDVYDRLTETLAGRVVVAHSGFDRLAIARDCERYGLEPPPCQWIDTVWVARQTWPDLARYGYGLRAVAWSLGITVRHHDAGEDAMACGAIMARAMAETHLTLAEWLEQAEQWRRRAGSLQTRVKRKGAADGPLCGEVITFTGELCMTRQQAADIAAQLGCDVASSVTKKTTILVVGVQNLATLAGYEKSSKHRRAEELIQQGHEIRIIHEDSFLALVREAD